VEFWKTTVRLETRRDDGQEEWVDDGSVDVRGRPVLRTKTGVWKATLFMIVLECSERLAYFAIVFNLIIYLTTVMREGLTTAVKNVSYWTGVTCVAPLIGGFLADTYFGRYWMVLISSVIYLSGLVLLTLSVSLKALKPPDQCDGICSKATTTQTGVFFLALYLISLGTSWHKPSLEAFGADQFDEEDRTESLKKSSFFNFWYFGLLIGLLLAVTVIAYIQEKVSWGFGFGIITVIMTITTVVFLCGTPFYRHKLPGESPITRIVQVLVGAIKKEILTCLQILACFTRIWMWSP